MASTFLYMYMANMSWNSSMNIPAVLRHLTERDEATGEYKIPKIIYTDAYFSEMVPYADLILPDTTYLERWDCISMLDRPISDPDAPADAIRQPVVQPDRDVRPFQTVLLDIGARLGLPGFVDDEGGAKYPGGYADYIVNHERAPGIGPLAGFRGEDGGSYGRGAPNTDQLNSYIQNGCFHAYELAPEHRYFRHINKGYLDWAVSVGFIGAADPITFQLYLEPLQTFRLAAEGHGEVQPPESHRQRIERFFDPIPFWYAPFEGSMLDEISYPMHAVTQRPMAMYHSWGSQNAWLRQIHGFNRLYMSRSRAKKSRDRGRWLGLDHQRNRPCESSGAPHGWRQRRYRLDVECDCQARGHLGARRRRARGQARVPAQPSHCRTAAGAGGWLSLFKQ